MQNRGRWESFDLNLLLYRMLTFDKSNHSVYTESGLERRCSPAPSFCKDRMLTFCKSNLSVWIESGLKEALSPEPPFCTRLMLSKVTILCIHRVGVQVESLFWGHIRLSVYVLWLLLMPWDWRQRLSGDRSGKIPPPGTIVNASVARCACFYSFLGIINQKLLNTNGVASM